MGKKLTLLVCESRSLFCPSTTKPNGSKKNKNGKSASKAGSKRQAEYPRRGEIKWRRVDTKVRRQVSIVYTPERAEKTAEIPLDLRAAGDAALEYVHSIPLE